MFRWPDLLVRLRGPEREGVSAPIAAIRCGMNQGLLRGHNILPQRRDDGLHLEWRIAMLTT